MRDLLYHKGLHFRWLNWLAIQDNFSWYIRNTRLGRYFFMAKPTDAMGIGVVMKERDRIVNSVLDGDGSVKQVALVNGSLLSSFLSTKRSDGSQMMSLTDVRAEVLFAL